jgi:hypothetical protein
MVRIIKGKWVLGRGGALILLVVLGGLNRMAYKDGYKSNEQIGLDKTEHLLDSSIHLLRQGDLVLRQGKDLTSYMIRRTNIIDKNYSHCGLVQIENGYPFVYHFIEGKRRNKHGLLRDSAATFFSTEYNNSGAAMHYDLSPQQIAKQTGLIHQYYHTQLSFDPDFDLKTDDKLYCAEFVYKVMNAVANDSPFIKKMVVNGFEYVPIDYLYDTPRASCIWQMAFK